MAKGHENLIPANKRSKAEARENSRKGGIASGVARRRKIEIQKLLELYATKKHSVPDEDGNEQTKMAAAVASFFERQIESGDANGFAKLMEAMGQKPAEKQEISGPKGSPITLVAFDGGSRETV